MGRVDELLFIWQTVFTAPLSIARGAVGGFSFYTKYLWADMTPAARQAAGSVCCAWSSPPCFIETLASIGRLSVILWVVVLVTVAWVLFAG
jgi:hypothetical protein